MKTEHYITALGRFLLEIKEVHCRYLAFWQSHLLPKGNSESLGECLVDFRTSYWVSISPPRGSLNLASLQNIRNLISSGLLRSRDHTSPSSSPFNPLPMPQINLISPNTTLLIFLNAYCFGCLLCTPVPSFPTSLCQRGRVHGHGPH